MRTARFAEVLRGVSFTLGSGEHCDGVGPHDGFCGDGQGPNDRATTISAITDQMA